MKRAVPRSAATGRGRAVHLRFADHRLLPLLFGDHDRFLTRIEQRLGITIASRGDDVTLTGSTSAVEAGRLTLERLYARLENGHAMDSGEVESALRLAEHKSGMDSELYTADEGDDVPAVATRRRRVLARSPAQAAYIRALRQHELVFGLGPAGTGKTYLAVAVAVEMLMAGRVDRLVLSRPAVEAGERLGFLPGDMREKIDPYLRPLYDALHDMIPGDRVMRLLASGEIEVAPLAFMRGRTLANSFVILDEAQNTTPAQMKMFLTRLGEHSRLVVTGDPSQADLPPGIASGLNDAVARLEGIDGIAMVRFTDRDVVRHQLVAAIIRAYDGGIVATRSPRRSRR
ncbi:MAG: PhoH family protein [Alphaproteobacteria bacterium]